MKKVFVFWIGDRAKIATTVEKIASQGFEVHVGPTSSEHEYLYKNFPFYRISFDQKIWSYCSDVWRLYMLSKYVGMYTDTSVHIGENFSNFYDDMIKKDTVIFRERKSLLASCVMFSGIKNNNFYNEILNIYKSELSSDVSAHVYELITWIISAFIFKEVGDFSGFDEVVMDFKNIKLHIAPITKILNENTLKKIGSFSWKSGLSDEEKRMMADDYWNKIKNNWYQRKDEEIDTRTIELLQQYGYLSPQPKRIRDLYDSSKTSDELKKYKNLYKAVPYHKKMGELLLWSKLYRFFTGKWLFTK